MGPGVLPGAVFDAWVCGLLRETFRCDRLRLLVGRDKKGFQVEVSVTTVQATHAQVASLMLQWDGEQGHEVPGQFQGLSPGIGFVDGHCVDQQGKDSEGADSSSRLPEPQVSMWPLVGEGAWMTEPGAGSGRELLTSSLRWMEAVPGPRPCSSLPASSGGSLPSHPTTDPVKVEGGAGPSHCPAWRVGRFLEPDGEPRSVPAAASRNYLCKAASGAATLLS